MKAEIISIGTELLLGQITNSNAAYISSRSASAGIFVYYHTAVGDNAKRLQEVIRTAESRSDLIIFTGGLGPTKDDLTKETIAAHLGVNLTLDKDALAYIKTFFERANRVMTPNNEKQALILENAHVLRNDVGMAPGMVLEKNSRMYVLLPGPPSEMQPMVEHYLLPYLVSKKEDGVLTSRVLKFYGIGEADLEHQLQDIIDAQTNPTIAPLAGDGEVTLRLTSLSESEEQNLTLLDELEATIAARVGDFIYGYDEDTIWSVLVDSLQEEGKTIAVAESLTAGLFTATVASISGASNVLKGGIVCYDETVKTDILGLSKQGLKDYGVYSEWCAKELALSVRSKLSSSIGVSFTGVAGPNSDKGVDPGTVYMAIATSEECVFTTKLSLTGNRQSVRMRASKWMANELRRVVKAQG